MTQSKELRYKFYHELETIYHRFFDEIAQADLGDGEAGRLTQALLLSRQEGLKHLVTTPEEMAEYLAIYPEDD
jgi:hercynine metabolism small protein